MYATELSELQSGLHGRIRREERRISKATLKAARRYGMREHSQDNAVVKYTFSGVTFVYNHITDREITSYAAPDYASPVAGTRCTLPLVMRRKYSTDPTRHEAEKLRHAQIRSRFFRDNHKKVTSHTVYVVDCSGSMRIDDVDGARCRSDAVWTSLARDGVQAAIESGSASITDIVSVVAMIDNEATTVLRCDPTDWILFNMLLEFGEWDTIRPEGPGCYIPAIKEAFSLLDRYDTGKQSLALTFVSDGKPSDNGDFVGLVGLFAQRFGRRLTVTCIGVGEDGDFQVMHDMVQEARHFQCNALFLKAAIHTSSLSKIITNVSSLIAASKVEMTRCGSQLQIRKDVLRERRYAPDDEALNGEWSVYDTSRHKVYNTVVRVWAWDADKDDFVCLMDPRCVICYQGVASSESMEADANKGILCGGCRSCFVCHDCDGKVQHRQKHSMTECSKWLQQRRRGFIIQRSIPSFNIAIKNKFFSEGVERLVAKVRYLDSKRNFIGARAVAKQSRFVEEENSYENRMDYHRQFLRTQAIAAQMAREFNNATSKLDMKVPGVEFLDPLVFELANERGEEVNHLLEDMLDGKYEKFNNNMGFVSYGKNRPNGYEYCDEGGDAFPVGTTHTATETETLSLTSRVDRIFDSVKITGTSLPVCPEASSEIPQVDEEANYLEAIQAFSHFSYIRSKHNFIVVDLQGVYVGGDTPKFVLTDPAIHSRSQTSRVSWMNLGRTDRGEKGIATFFMTHRCGETCRGLGLPQKYMQSHCKKMNASEDGIHR